MGTVLQLVDYIVNKKFALELDFNTVIREGRELNSVNLKQTKNIIQEILNCKNQLIYIKSNHPKEFNEALEEIEVFEESLKLE